MEARETTRTGARYRARTRCGAGGESAMLPGVMRVHLNYSECGLQHEERLGDHPGTCPEG